MKFWHWVLDLYNRHDMRDLPLAKAMDISEGGTMIEQQLLLRAV